VTASRHSLTKQVEASGPDVLVGGATTDKVGFYGTTPIVQRTNTAQATSLFGTASSTALDTATKAFLVEVGNALVAIGIWKGG
jgi:hypothetical protein